MDKKKKPQGTTSIQELENQLSDLDSKYKRALADYQNLLRQTQQERAEYLNYANAQLITQLLPLLDNLQMAYKHLQDPGLEMIVKQFQQTLTDEGIEEIKPKDGDHFDEHLHEALDTIATEDQAKVGLIAETALVGYRYKAGQVLRHAKVKVYKSNQES
jgi:molecular chaperone GrpE